MGHPKGSTSYFKTLEWEEQMNIITKYLKTNLYPDFIVNIENPASRKRMKRDLRKFAEGYKIIDNKLRKLKICKKFKDSRSESKYYFFN